MPVCDLRERISLLEAVTAALEPTASERREWQSVVDTLINGFIEELPERKAFVPRQNLLDLEQFDVAVGSDASLTDILATVKAAIADSGLLTAGPGHLGFVPGGGLYLGAVADHLAAAMNPYSADAFAAPVAAHINNQVVAWLTAAMGYDTAAWGDITSGGSQATLTAFYVARKAGGIKPRDYAATCIYIGADAHHCCNKALDLLFAGEVQVRIVPSLDHAMDPVALANAIEMDQALGLRPWLLIATAGSTNLGKVDPLAELAMIAKKHAMWMHVDGAYGGFFKLCPELDTTFLGINAADSIVLDPHKGMFLPYGSGAVLFKDGEHLRRAVAATGSYLQDRDHGSDRLRSPLDYSLELTRPFRALRIWLSLKLYGEDTLANALREKLLLARYCYEQLVQVENIVMVGTLDLSILGFRFEPLVGGSDANNLTRALLGRINERQKVFLTSTIIDGFFTIRVAILSFRTHLATIDALLKIVAQEAAILAQEAASI